jgi:hypothetical protein
MSKSIELPDPLFAEIDGYANRTAVSPVTVIRRAWNEFRSHHAQGLDSVSLQKPDPEELLSSVRSLRGSILLPKDLSDETLITQARMEKHGPL